MVADYLCDIAIKEIWGRPAIGSSVPVRGQLLQWDADYKPVKKNFGGKIKCD